LLWTWWPVAHGQTGNTGAQQPSSLNPRANKILDPVEMAQELARGAPVRVIVTLVPPEGAAHTDFGSRKALHGLQSQIQALQKLVLDSVPANGLKLHHQFDNIPGFSADVSGNALAALQAHPHVQSIEIAHPLELHLAQGVPLIHADTYRSTFNGAGVAIAICDVGVDYTHARLGGGGFPNSKVIGGTDLGDNDSDPFPTDPHGTSCAGIAAGDLGTVGDYIGGVAPGAKLYALKVSTGSNNSIYGDTVIAAWDWCVTHKNDDPNCPILVISSSLGASYDGSGQRFSTTCDTYSSAMTTAVNNAVAAGITVAASSGNDGFCDAIAWPACISSVLSVGAVYDAPFGYYTPCVRPESCTIKYATTSCTKWYCQDLSTADEVTCYSNTASFLSLLTPGTMTSTLDIVGPNGYSSGDYATSFSGTSAACPYAAGAAACLQSAAKAVTGAYLSVTDVINRLTSYGDNVTDGKVSIVKPRINLAQAIESLPFPPTISAISSQITAANVSTPAIPFTVSDTHTSPDQLAISGSSSDPSLVPASNLVFGGSGSARTLTVSPATNRSGTCTITVVASNGSTASSNTFNLTVNAAIAGEFIFYNNSGWDSHDPGANTNDDKAIAPDKVPLRPGGIGSFANYTSYTRGINGIMIDIAGLPGAPTINDFQFNVGNTSMPGSWGVAPAPSVVAVRAGAGTGGSDRITLIWPDNAIQKQWLGVTVLPTSVTGLASADVFYFGNAIGESGNSTTDATVTVVDALVALNAITPFAKLTSVADYDRDRTISVIDAVIALNNLAVGPSALKLINLTALSPGQTSEVGVPPSSRSNLAKVLKSASEVRSAQSGTLAASTSFIPAPTK
jgi:subtilisin family serine protease